MSDAGTADVYNLSVEDEEEYFANGILVHNCRYLAMAIGGGATFVIHDDEPEQLVDKPGVLIGQFAISLDTAAVLWGTSYSDPNDMRGKVVTQ